MTTDEVEKHQRDERQQAEPDQEARRAPPGEQLQPGDRHPASRGLARLFSSLLKRRSQCESPAGDTQDEGQSKAPIADPEPGLRAEAEAHEQQSLSSAEAQVSSAPVQKTVCSMSPHHHVSTLACYPVSS